MAEAACLGHSGEFSPQRSGMRKVQVLKIVVYSQISPQCFIYRRGQRRFTVGSGKDTQVMIITVALFTVSCPNNCKSTFATRRLSQSSPRLGGGLLAQGACMWLTLCIRQLQGVPLTLVIFVALYIYITAVF